VEKGWHFAVPPPLLCDWKRGKNTTALFSENQTGQSEKVSLGNQLAVQRIQKP
jgi:hypothetical protein